MDPLIVVAAGFAAILLCLFCYALFELWRLRTGVRRHDRGER